MAQQILPTLTPREAKALWQLSQHFALEQSMYRRLKGIGLIDHLDQKWALTELGTLKLSDTVGTRDEVQS